MSLLLFFRGCFCAGEMDSGAVKGLALAFEMDFWGVPKFMNSGFRTVGIISRCSEIMIKIGYGKVTTPTQVTYTRRELYLLGKLGELTGTNESLFFEWLRYAAVFFPLGSCVCTVCSSQSFGMGGVVPHSWKAANPYRTGLWSEGKFQVNWRFQCCKIS